MNRLVLVAAISSVVVIVWIVWLIRSRRLQERHALLWLAAAVIGAVLAVWQRGLGGFSKLIGVAYPPSALFIVAFVLLGLILLDTAIELSRTVARARTLAQRLAMLEERVEQLERDAPPAPPADADGDGDASPRAARLPGAPAIPEPSPRRER